MSAVPSPDRMAEQERQIEAWRDGFDGAVHLLRVAARRAKEKSLLIGDTLRDVADLVDGIRDEEETRYRRKLEEGS